MELGISESKSSLGTKNYYVYTEECLVSTADLLRPKKKRKLEELSPITLGYIADKTPKKIGEQQRMRVLFDSGCSATLINRSVLKGWKKRKEKTIKWSTKAGKFKTDRVCDIEFTLPALHENRIISCTAYVDESSKGDVHYDMIIGRDLMQSLGINLLFSTSQIEWDSATIYMQPPERLKDRWVEDLEEELLYAHDPETTDAERIQQIIDAKYCEADLQ